MIRKPISIFLSISVILSVFFINAETVQAATTMEVNKSYNVRVSQNEYGEGIFTPVVSGYYTVFSSNNTGDPYVELRDSSDSTIIAYNDDSNGTNFSLRYKFSQGVTYRFRFRCFNNSAGSYSVKIIPSFTGLSGTSGNVTVNISTGGDKTGFLFTPSESGVYRFYSNVSSNPDTKVWIYDYSIKSITDLDGYSYDDDDGNGNNFSISCLLTSGTSYVIAPGYYNSGTTGSYTMYYKKIVPESLDVTNSQSSYYVGDSVNKNTLTVVAHYPTNYEDCPIRKLTNGNYNVSLDSSKASKQAELTVKCVAGNASKTVLTEVIEPTIYATGNGYEYYDTDYTYLLSSINNTVTAVTSPTNADVNWSCSDSSVLEITKKTSKTANIYVKKPSTNPITITASYTYNGKEYKCSFMAQVFFTVESASISSKKTSYVYGDTFSREKIKATIVSGGNKESVTVNSTESLPSTKKTPGKYTRTVSFYDKTLSYKYTIKCAAPKIKSVSAASSTSQKITWNKAGGAKGYYVYRATSKNGSYKKVGTTTSTSYTSSKLKANKVYYYKVKAYYSKSSSAYDSAYSTVVSGRTKLSTPSSVKATAGKKKITVKWKKVSGAKGYYVYRATSKNGKYTKIATTSKASYTNTKLKSKKKYYYKVVAYSSTKGCNSAYSKVVSAKTK